MIEPTARGAADLTVLAVRAGNLRAGIGASGAGRENTQAPGPAAGAAPERGPAVQVDARTRALAEALAGAEASEAQAEGGDSAPRPVSAARLEMMAAMQHSIESFQRDIRDLGETLQIYEETGQVVGIQTTFSTGNVKLRVEYCAEALQPWGGAEGFISMLRERRERIISKHLPEAQKALSDFLAG